MQLSGYAITIVQAVLGTTMLTAAMAAWAGASRQPAINHAGLDLQDFAHVADARDRLPSRVRRINDNYNHLLEQPTVFYAVALAIVALGASDEIHAVCALAYLAIRIAHSAVHATFNRVAVRAPLYTLSWVPLLTMIVRAFLQTL